MTTYEIFHQRFCEVFGESGMTINEFAERTAIPYRKIKRYFNEKAPGARDLIRIACVLSVRVDYLLGLSDEK